MRGGVTPKVREASVMRPLERVGPPWASPSGNIERYIDTLNGGLVLPVAGKEDLQNLMIHNDINNCTAQWSVIK